VLRSTDGLAACGGWSRRKTLYGGDQLKPAADPLLDPAIDAARIRAMFVHPAHARRGLGRLLLDTCRAAARAEGFPALELGATLRLGFAVDPLFVEALIARIERAQREGGVFAGILPDKPLTGAQLRDEWTRALRTKNVALPLTKKRPTVSPDGDVPWFFDDT